MVVPVPASAYQRPKVLPVVNPPRPDVPANVPINVVPFAPSIKVFVPVLIVPTVNVSVPLTVPVFVPFIKELALEKVTPLALVLLTVIDVKFAIGEAAKFLKIPAPETVCAFVVAVTVKVVLVALTALAN